jgi:glycerol-3-phosphate dehydrogenase
MRIDLSSGPLGAPLKPRYRHGFEYSDCSSDDARLVVVNALDAAERGAMIRTRTRCVRAVRDGTQKDRWLLMLQGRNGDEGATARVLVNAAGPWAGIVSARVLGRPPLARLRLDQGSHIVLPRLFDHDRGYIFQTADRRFVFALPFENDFTLIGTTDRNFSGDPDNVAPTADEILYLCEVVNHHFRAAISPDDVVWSFAGVRSLYDDGSRRPQDTPRDYVLTLDGDGGEAPLLTVYGGKITTYRRLAEAALDRLAPVLGARAAWTRGSHLPGGDFPYDGMDRLIATTRASWPYLGQAHARRLVRSYGTKTGQVLRGAQNLADLGRCFGGDLHEAEVRHLMDQEWAETADDVLWRRSKLGLVLSREEREALAKFMAFKSDGRGDDVVDRSAAI